MRQCIIHTQTGLCINTIDDPSGTYTPPEGYSIAPDNTGDLYQFWDGDQWIDISIRYINAYLGNSPSCDTPDISDESDNLATTFYVKEKIQDYINNIWYPTAIFDGGKFTDAAIVADYISENFDDANSNLSSDVTSPNFSNSGGNLSGDINGGTF